MFASRLLRRKFWLVPLVVLVVALCVAAVALAQGGAPQPNALRDAPKDVDMTANGPAAAMHGDPISGRQLYAQNCAACHGPRGVGGIPNPGSDDGTVPPLNPADPGFYGNPQTDAATYAKNIDVFLQHGSLPEGEKPQLAMTAWGDKKLLTQNQIADLEAYVMQLNGVYWPDRWAPPLEIQMQASQTGNTVTYEMMLVNNGNSDITNVTLRDTLPAGMLYLTSYLPGPGQNPGKWNGSTVQWDHGSGVPQGGTLGPFVIVAQNQGSTVPPNVAQAEFSWTDLNGNQQRASAVSNPVVPGAPPAAPAKAAAPVAIAAAPAVTVTKPAPAITPVPTASVTVTTTAATPAPAAQATAAPTVAATVAPTAAPTTAPAAPTGDATNGTALFASKNCTACHMVNGKGGSVGPDLTHIATTPYGSLANDPASLAKWLHDPQAVKPGTAMPNPNLTDAEINDLVAYLQTLK